MQSTSVFLVDTNKLFREGLKALFTDGEFRITREASNLDEVLPILASEAAPELILIDPVAANEAVGAVKAIKAQCPESRLVLLTNHLELDIMANAILAGADGFLMKDISPEALAQSLRLVMMGEKVLPTHLALLLISGKVSGNGNVDAPRTSKGLSQREVQILRRLLNGDSNKMIANTLGITEATIKVHLKSLLRKINVTNRTQAAIWALNNGFSESADTELGAA
jgi:two-component system, NarL family, nitrate/nitrite response regulator NarL